MDDIVYLENFPRNASTQCSLWLYQIALHIEVASTEIYISPCHYETIAMYKTFQNGETSNSIFIHVVLQVQLEHTLPKSQSHPRPR